MVALYSLLAVFVVSLISFVGVISLALQPEKLKKAVMLLVSLSAGTMLGGAVLHLLPEALSENSGSVIPWFWFLAGIIIFFVLERLVCWRHCHIPTSPDHPHHLGIMNLVGDGLHNFIDGMVIAGAFIISFPLGIVTTIAVIAHEIPQEIGDFGVLIYAGFNRAKAIVLNFLTALFAVLGAVVVLVAGIRPEQISSSLLPLAAGGFIYIAMADLLPELRKDADPLKSLKQFLFIMVGIILMYALKFLEH
ncbi:MAG: ZIP family metal transporter [Patescibacteria group bacterium]|jgi:zinc and cadmium transporter